MEDTQNPTNEVEVTTTEAISSTSEPETETPQSEMSPLDALIQRRMGTFGVKISHADLKYVKNSINQKVEWKGSNEAYLTIMAILTIDNALQTIDPKGGPVQIELPSSTIESANYFLNKISGKGIDSAQKLFSVSMMFRPAMEAIRKIDEEIATLKGEAKS